MLIRPISDIHLEQYAHSTVPINFNWANQFIPPLSTDSEAVLVLAGDICEFGYVDVFKGFWRELANRFKAVIYVPGNHEYWGLVPYGSKTYFKYKEYFRSFGKIHLLDNNSVVIDGVTFYGTTLWTNYDNNPLFELASKKMGDFRYATTAVEDGVRTATTQDYIERYADSRVKLELAIQQLKPTVIVSHFAPSFQSVHEKYRSNDSYATNFHFIVSMEALIDAHPHLKMWIHGHVHDQFDYTIGNTRVICNPYGYNGENVDRFTDLSNVEVL